MARVVGVHGIGQQYKGGYELQSIWFNSLRDGLIAANAGETAHGLIERNLTVSFFGDYFRPAGAMGSADPPYTAADIAPGQERELLMAFYAGASAIDASLAAPDGAMGEGKVAVQVILARLLRSKTFAGLAQRAFIGNLKQVTKFMDDSRVKDHVLNQVHQNVTAETVVMIGHSLGSIIAYEYLCRYRPESVQLLVTLGSPLGIPNVVFEKLTPKPVGGLGVWPGVTSWVNVADPDDAVAMRKTLASLFTPPNGVDAVSDQLVDNGDSPHAITRYLNSRETGRAVAASLAS